MAIPDKKSVRLAARFSLNAVDWLIDDAHAGNTQAQSLLPYRKENRPCENQQQGGGASLHYSAVHVVTSGRSTSGRDPPWVGWPLTLFSRSQWPIKNKAASAIP